MLKIHQPYKSKYLFALVSIGVLLLGSLVVVNSSSENSIVYAAGDSRTIHDISNMQEMTQQICSNTDEGDTGTLSDSRDANSYVVVKLKDGNCWMQENLKLGGSSVMTLTSTDSDLASGTSSWELPASASNARWGGSGSWGTSDTATQMRVGEPDMPVSPAGSGDGNGWQPGYGNYYSWCAATAGSCTSVTVDGSRIGGSICPKNWHLPTGNTGGEFYNIVNDLTFNDVIVSPYRFYASGCINGSGVFLDPGTRGDYWSGTARASGSAYKFSFGESALYPGTSTGEGRFGFSVRCVASGGLEKIEKPVWQDTADAGINVTVPKVITLDVSDGVNATADAYNVVTGEIVATVTSNNINYEVLLSSEQPSLIGQKDSTNSIPVVSSTNPVEKSNNAWGILNASNLYDPITKTPQQFYNTTAVNGNAISHTYTVGISISPTLPADTYSTTVTVTASSK